MASIFVNSNLVASMSFPVGIITNINNNINHINNLDLRIVYLNLPNTVCINNIITNSNYLPSNFNPNNFNPANFIINGNLPNTFNINNLNLTSNSSISIIRNAIEVNDPNLSFPPIFVRFLTDNYGNLNRIEVKGNGGILIGYLQYNPQNNSILFVHGNVRILFV